MSITIRLAETDDEIAGCFPVLVQLRPHLRREEFLSRARAQEREGFRLAFLADEGGVRSVAGFRLMNFLFSGRTLYVDDLVSEEQHRSRGYGAALFDWLVEHARRAGCERFSLDSGTQRVDAHRFYLRKRMRIASFHFDLPLA
jgi:GNAT superfamily N-acetyltransferase